MRATKTILLITLVALVVGACRPESQGPQQPTGPTEPSEVGQVTGEQQQVMQEILAYLKQSGNTLEALAQEVQRREARERVPSPIETLAADVRVAKGLVGAARRAATAQSTQKTTAALARLGPALASLRSQIPAAVITQHLERARVAISSASAEEAVNLASAYLLGAVETAMRAPARLVPDVMKDIERAKAQVDKKNLAKGATQILAILERLTNHESIGLVERTIGAARGTQDALAREAWSVVAAELDQLDSLLAQLQRQIEGEVTPVATEEAPEAAEEEAPPEELAPEAEGTVGTIPEGAPPAEAPPTPPTTSE